MKVNDRYCSFYYAPDPIDDTLHFDPRKTALLLIDLQEYFVTPQKPLTDPEMARWRPFYQEVQEVVVPNNERLLTACRQKGITIVHITIMSQFDDGRERSLSHRRAEFNNIIIGKDVPEGAIVPQLAPRPNEIIVAKTTHSGLTGTNLRLILNNLGITDCIATGLVTDQCVSCTVRSLSDENYRVWVVEDATMAGTHELRDHELTIMNNTYCNVVNTQEVLDYLATQ